MGAGFSIGEGVMMICQVEAAMCSDGMKLMVFQIREYLYGSSVGTIKLIVRISHPIMSKTSFQTTLVERLVVSYERQVFYISGSLMPDLRKSRSFLCIFLPDPMNFGIPVTIIIRDWSYQTIKTIHNLPVSYDDNSHTAGTSYITVCRLEIYSSKVREIGYNNLIIRLFQHIILLSQHGKYPSHHLRTYIR